MPPPFVIRPSYRPVFQASRYFSGAGGIDPDAAAYIAAIEGDGVTVSNVQREAINDWYVTGKSEGWYSSLKRHYLPIWANASANARCMVSGTSGTFTGTVTHAAGYVQGDGSTGYFNTGFNLIDGGITPANCWFGCLWYDWVTGRQNGVFSSPTTSMLLTQHPATPGFSTDILGSGGRDQSSSASLAECYGVLSAGRQSGTTRHRLLRNSGIAISNDFVRGDAGAAPNAAFYWMARHRADSASTDLFSDTKLGFMWMGIPPTDDLDEAFILSGKILWETCTGMIIP